jgi:hypothetical protein
MHNFTVCSVILSDSNIGEILVATRMGLPAQRTTLPSRNGEKHRFMRAYRMLDMCQLSVLNTELNIVILSVLDLYQFVIFPCIFLELAT